MKTSDKEINIPYSAKCTHDSATIVFNLIFLDLASPENIVETFIRIFRKEFGHFNEKGESRYIQCDIPLEYLSKSDEVLKSILLQKYENNKPTDNINTKDDNQ